MPLPSDGVLTRLGPSPLHGVGVFAIMRIPGKVALFKGVFGASQAGAMQIKETELRDLPSAVRRLYDDFCMRNGDTYHCPTSFDRMSTPWYLNHSESPNCGYDMKTDRLFTLREIAPGEELTVNYGDLANKVALSLFFSDHPEY